MKPERQAQLDEAWLEALLESAYGPADPEQQQARIAAVMGRLASWPDQAIDQPADQAIHKAAEQPVWSEPTRSAWLSLRHLSTLAIAASLLVLALFVIDTTDGQAYAALARSAQAMPLVRHYQAHIVLQRPMGGQRQLTADIYIDPENRYVIKHPAMVGQGTTWLGGDSHQRWMVPPRGPAYLGGHQILEHWLAQRDESSPLLHLNTILERMSKAYTLTLLPDEVIDSVAGAPLECTHVRGQLAEARGRLPRSIDLWADINTGVAQKLMMAWPEGELRRGPLRWTIQLVETNPELAEDWFELSRHAAGRRIVNVKSEREIEAVD